MNTATCCSPVVLATRQSLPLRWWGDLKAQTAGLWQAHRARAQLRAERRSLQGLSDATLRDIGLADRQIDPAYTLGVLDHERGRWS
jgi:uncharacterized protein YjiS (DUF1127 family)